MAKKKLQRFADVQRFHNVIEPPYTTSQSETVGYDWNAHFKKKQPLCLELACGKGEYTVAMAKRNPNVNYIGVDIKGARIWYGAREALELSLDNVCFLRTRIEWLSRYFAPESVDEIWITFPDPHMKVQRTKHRLTHPTFIERYTQILCPGGRLHLKTDNGILYGYTMGIMENQSAYRLSYSHHDLYTARNVPDPICTEVQTYYEAKFSAEGKSIKYAVFEKKCLKNNCHIK